MENTESQSNENSGRGVHVRSRTFRLMTSLRRPFGHRAAILLPLFAMLGACGGEEGENGANQEPTPPSLSNVAPVISGTPEAQVLVGDQYSFVPIATDPDGDSVTFSIQNRPEWASFDSTTGRLSGTPSADHLRIYKNIRIAVTDGAATTVLPAFSIEVVDTATGVATLTWTAPETRTDGGPLSVAGYKVYWGKEPKAYSKSTTLDGNVLTYVVDQLTAGTWYFAVTAFDDQRVESDFSNEASKQVRF